MRRIMASCLSTSLSHSVGLGRRSMAESSDSSDGFVTTPTWVVAVVVTIIVGISLIAERLLYFLGKTLKHNSRKSLYEAVLKVKEELMLMGFISFLLSIFEDQITSICVNESIEAIMLPCKTSSNSTTITSSNSSTSCDCKEGQVQFISEETLDQLHIFIFVLAVTHVILSVITIGCGRLELRRWKKWEDKIAANSYEGEEDVMAVKDVYKDTFIEKRAVGAWSWMYSFVKQFYASVTEPDYVTLRWGFISEHQKGNPSFDFHTYMIRAFEDDFMEVVGINWYLWGIVIIFLLINISGVLAYFWITLIPLAVLLAVGMKLEHIITQLARDVAEKNAVVIGDITVHLSNRLFWFSNPKLLHHLIHYILFQNAFEIAYFFWVLVTYKINSCLLEGTALTVIRIIIWISIQSLCSFSTLPLYALVTQMGDSYNKAIFDEFVQTRLHSWARNIKKKKKIAGSSAEGDWGDRGVHTEIS